MGTTFQAMDAGTGAVPRLLGTSFWSPYFVPSFKRNFALLAASLLGTGWVVIILVPFGAVYSWSWELLLRKCLQNQTELI